VEILGKLCFARLKLNLKTEDRFKLKTKLGQYARARVQGGVHLHLLLLTSISLHR